MKVLSLKCTYCGASISDVDDEEGIAVCSYCGSKLYIKDYEDDDCGFEERPAKKYRVPACCVAKSLPANNALADVMNGMSDMLDEKHDSESIIPVNVEMLKDRKEATTAISFVS